MVMNRTATYALVASWVLLTLGATPAVAQKRGAREAAQTLGSQKDRPWAQGVSEDQQQAAYVVFKEANALLKESLFVRAAAKYREALKHWDHPAIHYNLSLALLNLDQPIEVHEHLVAALRYGPVPLDPEKFEHARGYKNLLEKQLAWVEIICDVPGASVVMDGKPLFTGPGRFEGLVRAGPHTIAATREGYLPTNLNSALAPGEKSTLDLKMFTTDDLTEYRRKWAVWKPWAVLGAGAAVALAGGALHWQARESFQAFDREIIACGGCALSETQQGGPLLNRGELMQNVAIGSYAVGGAAVLTGAVLVYVNRLQPYRVNPEGEVKDEPKVGVTPLVGSGTGGVLATFRF